MNNYAKHIGLPAKPIEAGGETYQPREIKAILQELARLGINEDKLIAQINPREAAILKRLGGSGKINPATGLMSFDEGGEGGSGNDSGNEGGSAASGEGGSSDEGGGGWGGWGGGWGGYGDTGDEAGYTGEAGAAMSEAASGYGFTGTSGTTDGTTSGATEGGTTSDSTESGPAAGSQTDGEPTGEAPTGEAPTDGTLPGQATVNAILDSVVDWLLSGRQSVETTAEDVEGGFQGKSSPSASLAAALAAEDAARATEAPAAAPGTAPGSGGLMSGESLYSTSPGLTAAAPGAEAYSSSLSTASNTQDSRGDQSIASTSTEPGQTTEARTEALTDLPVTEIAPAPSVFDITTADNRAGPVTDQPSVAAVIEDLARQDARPDGLDQTVFMPDTAATLPAADLVTMISSAAEKAAEEKKKQEFVADAIRRQRNYLLGQQNYANGGLVDPTRPTQAFTDGAFTPGYVSAPPGLTAYDSFGSDAMHASPLAPAPAASVPMLSMGYPMSMYMNKNAGPVASPVPQNPNVAASVGPGPLSRLG